MTLGSWSCVLEEIDEDLQEAPAQTVDFQASTGTVMVPIDDLPFTVFLFRLE